MAARTLRSVDARWLSIRDRVVQSAGPKLKKEFLAAMQGARKEFRALMLDVGPEQAFAVAEIWEGLYQGLLSMYVQNAGLDSPDDVTLSLALEPAIIAAGKAAAALSGVRWTAVEEDFRASAAQWALDHGAVRVTQITADTRRTLGRLISDSFHAPVARRQLARDIVAIPGLGLDAPRAKSLLGYIADLREAGRSEEDIARLADRRFDFLLRRRAETIASTEAADAGNAAIDLFYQEASASGEIDPEEMELEWVTRVVDVCPLCEAFDGARRSVSGGRFESQPVASGKYEGQALRAERPTLHPRCACGLRTVAKGQE